MQDVVQIIRIKKLKTIKQLRGLWEGRETTFRPQGLYKKIPFVINDGKKNQ